MHFCGLLACDKRLVINVLFYLLCIIKKSVISKTTSWNRISIEDIVQLSVQTSEGYSCVYICVKCMYAYTISSVYCLGPYIIMQ